MRILRATRPFHSASAHRSRQQHPADMSSSRPLLQFSLDELTQRYQSSQNDTEALAELHAELLLRKTRGARDLGVRASRRLTELASVTTATAVRSSTLEANNVNAGKDWVFDEDQRSIVEAPPGNRVIVNAPPGTGKTAVACGRIAWLINHRVPPHQIWLLSFTRTAIRELRNRIALLAESSASVHAVKVATLDARAWSLVQGFDHTPLAERVGSYDATVQQALEILRSGDDAVLDLLRETSHVIVDEAQDLVGVRAEFVLELIARLPEHAGVTILTDDAQAIYGFAEEEESDYDTGTLPELLRAQAASGFKERELRTCHRADSESLNELYIAGRRRVLSAVSTKQDSAIRVVRECIAASKDGDVDNAKHRCPAPGTLQLYRTRMEVLNASCWLGTQSTPHRIRMSGMPVVVHPWVGLALSDLGDEELTKAELFARWSNVIRVLGPLSPDPELCWADMVRATGQSRRIRMAELRAILSRPRPPLEFVTGELGLSGPILGTIHASKGREADHVELMLPPEREKEENPAEEARVLFVGATRAKKSLHIGNGETRGSTSLSHGRRFSNASPQGSTPRIRLEIGLEGDVDLYSPVAEWQFENADDVLASQAALQDSLLQMGQVHAWRYGSGQSLRYIVRLGANKDGQVLAALSREFTWSLYEARKIIAKGGNLNLPQYIGPLFRFSVGTVVRDIDDPELNSVHEPWRTSGIWLAPIITGLPTVPFFRSKYGS